MRIPCGDEQVQKKVMVWDVLCSASWNGRSKGLGHGAFIPAHLSIIPVTHSACIICSAGMGLFLLGRGIRRFHCVGAVGVQGLQSPRCFMDMSLGSSDHCGLDVEQMRQRAVSCGIKESPPPPRCRPTLSFLDLPVVFQPAGS